MTDPANQRSHEGQWRYAVPLHGLSDPGALHVLILRKMYEGAVVGLAAWGKVVELAPDCSG